MAALWQPIFLLLADDASPANKSGAMRLLIIPCTFAISTSPNSLPEEGQLIVVMNANILSPDFLFFTFVLLVGKPQLYTWDLGGTSDSQICFHPLWVAKATFTRAALLSLLVSVYYPIITDVVIIQQE
jgi:hypothetical protein